MDKDLKSRLTVSTHFVLNTDIGNVDVVLHNSGRVELSGGPLKSRSIMSSRQIAENAGLYAGRPKSAPWKVYGPLAALLGAPAGNA